MASGTLKERLGAAARAGLGLVAPGKGTTRAKSAGLAKDLDERGIHTTHFGASDEEIAEFVDRLWDDQNDPVAERQREWLQIEHYVANEQYLAYHRGRRDWIIRRTVPWRIRAVYNICAKCVNLRVQRLTENKPAISVQAATVDMGDVQKAEYKQTLFWGLWEKLALHKRIVGVRTKATLNGCAFLKVGWDPDAGIECPATRKKVKYTTANLPVPDPATGEPQLGPDGVTPLTAPQQVYAGIEEVYIDKNKQELGPVESKVDDEDNPGEQKTVRNPVPDLCELYSEGEVFVDERRAANIRWDRYVDDPDESWYIQDSEVMPGFKIVAMYGEDVLDVLKDATAASEDDKLQFRSALMSRDAVATSTGDRSYKPKSEEQSWGALDDEYVVRETWIYPMTPVIKKLWGQNGAKIVTIGGKVAFKSEVAEWARKKRNFIRFVDVLEEGNHYCKPLMRDVLPLQDDINRSRSQMAERGALESRLILGAPQNHQMNLRLLGGMPGVLLTYRDAAHAPQPINLTQQGRGAEEFYQGSLAAASDLGNMNEASTGKLPSAGLAAKAIYALQYADERSISLTSTLQDESLKKLALAIDAVTRVEYKEARKIRISGEDRDFLVESEIVPDQLETDIDYFFTPGSMLSKQKEAVRNEMIALRDARLIDDATARKFIASAVPDVFRQSNDLHEAKARRNLQDILRRGEQPTADPWDDPTVHLGVLQEYMLTRKWKVTGDTEKKMIVQLWQAFKLMLQGQQPAPAPGGAPGPAGGAPPAGAPPDPAAGGGAPPGAPLGAPPPADGGVPEGAASLEQRATQAQSPPEPGGSPLQNTVNIIDHGRKRRGKMTRSDGTTSTFEIE